MKQYFVGFDIEIPEIVGGDIIARMNKEIADAQRAQFDAIMLMSLGLCQTCANGRELCKCDGLRAQWEAEYQP